MRAETIEFLRDQLRQAQLANTQMQEKFLSLVGDAAEKYHRIKMTEMAQQHQGITDGVVPMEAIDDDDKMLDEFMNGFMNGGPQ